MDGFVNVAGIIQPVGTPLADVANVSSNGLDVAMTEPDAAARIIVDGIESHRFHVHEGATGA